MVALHQPKVTEFKLTGARLPDTFLMGSHLCRVPMPPLKELLADMDNLKRHGFNLIKLQTHWAVDEPLEGKYEFERYDSLVQHAKDLGMLCVHGFYPGTGSFMVVQQIPGMPDGWKKRFAHKI